MAGFPQTIHRHVFVATPFQCKMHFHAPEEGSLHNELRDITVSLLKETCHGVVTESCLQPITSDTASVNKQDGARLDIVANGFWGGRAFFVRVFNPFTPSNRHSSLASASWNLEEEALQTESSRSRTLLFYPPPLCIVAHRGSCNAFYKCLASQFSKATILFYNWLATFLLIAQVMKYVPEIYKHHQ